MLNALKKLSAQENIPFQWDAKRRITVFIFSYQFSLPIPFKKVSQLTV